MEAARAVGGDDDSEPSWLDHFLGLIFAPAESDRDNQTDNSDDDILSASNDRTDENALVGQDAASQKPQASRPLADNVTVGNSVYNESSGLRPSTNFGPGSAQDLSSARAAAARVTKNRDAAGVPVGHGTASGQLAKSEGSAVKTYPPAKSAYTDSQAAANKATGNPAGPQNFYLDYGQPKPPWAQGRNPSESYGPFLNPAGRGDVPRGAKVWIRIYE